MCVSHHAVADGLFFIVGTGRCGTTLLQAMLSSHSRLAIPAETRFFGQADPVSAGLHDPLLDTELETYISARRSDWWWKELGLVDEEFAAAVRGGQRSAKAIYLWMLHRLTANLGKPRVGEKTPYYGQWAEHLLALFPKARFIHLHRDSRDVIASLRSQKWWVAKSAMSCVMVCRDVLDHQAGLRDTWSKDRLLTVRYETLVKHPADELERVCRFLDEQFESAMLRFHGRTEVGFLELERDWKGLTLQPLSESRIGRYRRELPDREIRLVEWLLGRRLTELGYERDSHAEDDPDWPSSFVAERERWEAERARSGPERLIDVDPLMRSSDKS